MIQAAAISRPAGAAAAALFGRGAARHGVGLARALALGMVVCAIAGGGAAGAQEAGGAGRLGDLFQSEPQPEAGAEAAADPEITPQIDTAPEAAVADDPIGFPAGFADPFDLADLTLTRFFETCGAAILTPQAYIDGVPDQGEWGESVRRYSPDGRALVISIYRDNAIEEVSLFGLPDGLHVTCAVEGIDAASQMAVSQSSAMADGEWLRFTSALAEAFQLRIAEIEDVRLAGGETNVSDAELYASLSAMAAAERIAVLEHVRGSVNGDSDFRHTYAIELDFAGGRRLVQGEITSGALRLTTYFQRAEGPGQ